MPNTPINIFDLALNRREIRRNFSNQIISYTLNDDSDLSYGLIRIPAKTKFYNSARYNNTIDEISDELINPTPDLDVQIVGINYIDRNLILDTNEFALGPGISDEQLAFEYPLGPIGLVEYNSNLSYRANVEFTQTSTNQYGTSNVPTSGVNYYKVFSKTQDSLPSNEFVQNPQLIRTLVLGIDSDSKAVSLRRWRQERDSQGNIIFLGIDEEIMNIRIRQT